MARGQDTIVGHEVTNGFTVETMGTSSATILGSGLTVMLRSDGYLPVFSFYQSHVGFPVYNFSLWSIFESSSVNVSERMGFDPSIDAIVEGSMAHFVPRPWNVAQMTSGMTHIVEMTSTFWNAMRGDMVVATVEFTHYFFDSRTNEWELSLNIYNYTFVDSNSSLVIAFNFTSSNSNATYNISKNSVIVGRAFFNTSNSNARFKNDNLLGRWVPVNFVMTAFARSPVSVYLSYGQLPENLAALTHTGMWLGLNEGVSQQTQQMQQQGEQAQKQSQQEYKTVQHKHIKIPGYDEPEPDSPELMQQMQALMQGVEQVQEEEKRAQGLIVRTWSSVRQFFSGILHSIF
ncbi:hypothetical protein Pelo_12541 [Pelomyxa schiedti]|nr:hypothetical protein Pelo_12541 [Pelomyxa schiedti]